MLTVRLDSRAVGPSGIGLALSKPSPGGSDCKASGSNINKGQDCVLLWYLCTAGLDTAAVRYECMLCSRVSCHNLSLQTNMLLLSAISGGLYIILVCNGRL